MNRDPLVVRLARVEARAAPLDWRWASDNRAAIDANWAQKTAAKPRMYNGRVLLLQNLAL